MDHDEPWRDRQIGISAHAIVRWLERVCGVDVAPLRRIASSLVGPGAGRPSDKAVVRLLEKGLLVDLDPIRREIRQAIEDGETRESRGHLDVLMASGHAVVVQKDHAEGWTVTTVLTPAMAPGRRPPPAPAEGGRPEGDQDDTAA